MYHVCLHLLSDDISILIGCRSHLSKVIGDHACILIGQCACTYPQMTYTCMSKTGFGDCVFLLEGINLFKVSVFALTCTLR